MNKTLIKDLIIDEIGNDYTVEFKKIEKDNGVKEAIIVSKGKLGITYYYDNKDTDSEIANECITVFRHSFDNPPFDVDDICGNIPDWNWAKDKVLPTLYNTTKNTYDNLITMPFVSDLGIMFKVEVNTSNVGQSLIKITKDIFKMWNISCKTLYDTALDNLDKILVVDDVQNIAIKMMTGQRFTKRYVNPSGMMDTMTSTSMVGAASAVLLLPRLIADGEMTSNDYYVIPSSRHEVLLIQAGSIDPKDLNAMICDVNTDIVSNDDFLSNAALLYKSETEDFIVA